MVYTSLGMAFLMVSLHSSNSFGGCIGKSQHQYLIDLQLQFQNQPNIQALNIVSLTRAGTGFNQVDPLKRGVEQVKRFQLKRSVVCGQLSVAGYDGLTIFD